jgi:hypothetical protein
MNNSTEFNLEDIQESVDNKFAIKICLYSENAAYVPKIQDLRGIAVL